MAIRKTIDDDVNDVILNDQTPAGEAVKHLIDVKPRVSGMSDTDIELKTDLDSDEIRLHTVADVLSTILESKPDVFNSKCIISDLVNKKERKSLSKNRLSRQEIVAVARQPDMFMGNPEQQQSQGFIKRLFMPRRQQPY